MSLSSLKANKAPTNAATAASLFACGLSRSDTMTTTFTAFGGGSFQDELTSDDLIVHSDERVENDADENIIADLIDDDDELDDEIVQRNLNFCRDEYLKEFRRSRNQSPSKKSSSIIDEKCEEIVNNKPRLIMQEEHIEETTKTCQK